MTARVLDGRAIASQVLSVVKHRAMRVTEGSHRPPCLAFVMIGHSQPARVFATRLEKLSDPVGVRFVRHHLTADLDVSNFEREVIDLGADEEVDGILIQMPLPEHLALSKLSSLIDARKDVDGISVENAGRLYLGLPGHTPSTATAMLQILDSGQIDVAGRHAVVVGRSSVVGHPVAELLLQRDATVTITHRRTRDLGSVCREADILMVAAGTAHLVTEDMIKPGCTIVDAGINVTADGIVGDVDFVACSRKAAAITRVPGGVGPVTNAVLLRHVVASAERRDA